MMMASAVHLISIIRRFLFTKSGNLFLSSHILLTYMYIWICGIQLVGCHYNSMPYVHTFCVNCLLYISQYVLGIAAEVICPRGIIKSSFHTLFPFLAFFLFRHLSYLALVNVSIYPTVLSIRLSAPFSICSTPFSALHFIHSTYFSISAAISLAPFLILSLSHIFHAIHLFPYRRI